MYVGIRKKLEYVGASGYKFGDEFWPFKNGNPGLRPCNPGPQCPPILVLLCVHVTWDEERHGGLCYSNLWKLNE